MDEACDAFIGLLKASRNLTTLMWQYNVPPQTLLNQMMNRFDDRCKKCGINVEDAVKLKRSFEAGIKGQLTQLKG